MFVFEDVEHHGGEGDMQGQIALNAHAITAASVSSQVGGPKNNRMQRNDKPSTCTMDTGGAETKG